MERFFRKKYKFIAVLLGIILIAQMFIFVIDDKAVPQTKAETNADGNDDSKIAADISNMTGVKIEEIIKLKQSGLSWNEILEKLKNGSKGDDQQDKSKRSDLLAEAGIEDVVKKLQDQGFSHEEILEAKMVGERVEFQLKEITNATEVTPPNPIPDMNLDKKKEEKKEIFKKIAEQFEVKSAIYFMMMLKKDFGSLEAALDEYLSALQTGLNLEDYIQDKEKYVKAKEEKGMGMTRDSIITVSAIELAMLENIQHNNQTAKDDELITQGKGSSVAKESKEKTLLPDVPMPGVKDVKPDNPAAEIMKEINGLNPNKP